MHKNLLKSSHRLSFYWICSRVFTCQNRVYYLKLSYEGFALLLRFLLHLRSFLLKNSTPLICLLTFLITSHLISYLIWLILSSFNVWWKVWIVRLHPQLFKFWTLQNCNWRDLKNRFLKVMLMIDEMRLPYCRICHFNATFLADLHLYRLKGPWDPQMS